MIGDKKITPLPSPLQPPTAQGANKIPFGTANGNGFYVPNGCDLVITIRNSVTQIAFGFTVNVKVSYIDKWGNLLELERIVASPTLTSDREADTVRVGLAECLIQSVHVFSAPGFNILRGQIFALIQISYGGPNSVMLATLAADYVEAMKPCVYPLSGTHSPTEGKGLVYTVTHANVADGGMLQFIPPDHTRWRVLSLVFVYAVVGGGAAQDFLIQHLDRIGNIISEYGTPQNAPIAAAASAAFTVAWNYIGNPLADALFTRGGVKRVLANFPIEMTMYARQQLNIIPKAAQVGDLMNNIALEVEEFIEPRGAGDIA